MTSPSVATKLPSTSSGLAVVGKTVGVASDRPVVRALGAEEKNAHETRQLVVLTGAAIVVVLVFFLAMMWIISSGNGATLPTS